MGTVMHSTKATPTHSMRVRPKAGRQTVASPCARTPAMQTTTKKEKGRWRMEEGGRRKSNEVKCGGGALSLEPAPFKCTPHLAPAVVPHIQRVKPTFALPPRIGTIYAACVRASQCVHVHVWVCAIRARGLSPSALVYRDPFSFRKNTHLKDPPIHLPYPFGRRTLTETNVVPRRVGWASTAAL